MIPYYFNHFSFPFFLTIEFIDCAHVQNNDFNFVHCKRDFRVQAFQKSSFLFFQRASNNNRFPCLSSWNFKSFLISCKRAKLHTWIYNIHTTYICLSNISQRRSFCILLWYWIGKTYIDVTISQVSIKLRLHLSVCLLLVWILICC